MTREDSAVDRRKVLKLTSGVLGGGLMTGTAVAAKDKKKTVDSEIVGKFEELMDSITIVNGKAKVKNPGNSQEKVEVSANGKSLKFTAKKIVKQINEGVKDGYWKIKKIGGELNIDLTEEGRSQFLKDGDEGFQTLSHCDGQSGPDGDFLYLDDDDVDSIQWGSVLSFGVFSIASAIAGVIAGIGLITIVLAAAAVLATVSAAYIAITNEGCGIKIDTVNDTVSSQHCDC